VSGVTPQQPEEQATTAQPRSNRAEGGIAVDFGAPRPIRYEATYQDPDEAAHKRQLEAHEARINVLLNAFLQVLGSLVLVAIIGVCLSILARQGYPATTVDKVAAILVAIVSGGFGYFAGQRAKK
jgi:hypothetical protein